MNKKPERIDGLPSFIKSWTVVYVFVIAFLVLLIVLFKAFSVYYS